MFKLSKLADYGTMIMAHMAREPERLMSAADIGIETGFALPTIGKVLTQMVGPGHAMRHAIVFRLQIAGV